MGAGVGMGGQGHSGKNWENCNRITIIKRCNEEILVTYLLHYQT